MKKDYVNPEMKVVEVKATCILTGSKDDVPFDPTPEDRPVE